MDIERFSFFVICDPRNNLDFEVYYTSMKDPRLRFSAMKSAWKRWAESDVDSNEEPYRSYFRFFSEGYVTFILIEKKGCTKKEANEHVNCLHEARKARYKDSRPTYSTNRVTFD